MAAKDTADLREAKSKLEKEVEELTWRLKLEKRIRAGLEETKISENEKWQTIVKEMLDQSKEAKSKLKKEVEELTWRLEKRIRALEETQNQVNVKWQTIVKEMHDQSKRTKEQFRKEREVVNAMKDLEEACANKDSSSKEIVDKLIAEIGELKDTVSSLEHKVDETEKKYEESHKLSEERLQQVNQAESNINEMIFENRRLQHKINEMNAEEQILRQQIMLAPSASRRRFSFPKASPDENDHLVS